MAGVSQLFLRFYSKTLRRTAKLRCDIY